MLLYHGKNILSCVKASFGVTYLFTNVPLDETIDGILTSHYTNTVPIDGMGRLQFQSLLVISTRDILFYFDRKL